MAPYTALQEFVATYKTLMAHGSERDQLLAKHFANRPEATVLVDGQMMTKHDLIRSETLDGASLLRPDLVRLINEGAQPGVDTLSELYYVFNTVSNQVKVPKGNKNSFGSYAAIGSEGNGVTVDNNRILHATIDIIKPMTTVEITREMMQDSEIELMGREIAAAGARLANTMQSIALYELQNNAAEDSSETVTSAKTLKEAINMEIANIQKSGYVPDRIQLTPKAMAWLRDEILNGFYNGNEQMTMGKVPTLYGIPCHVTAINPATYSSPNYTPGAGTFGGTNGIGAIVYAKDKSVGVAIRDGIGTDTPFKDVYKDLTALTATCRFGAGAIHKLDTTNADVNAAVYISY